MNKKSRHHRKQLKNSSKKRKGGMFSSNAKQQLFKTKTLPELEHVEPAFKKLLLSIRPGSGFHAHVTGKMLEPFKTASTPGYLQAQAVSAITSLPPDGAVAKGLGIRLFERAQRMRAHSFRNHNIEECARINQKAEKLLKKAIEFGNLQARAALAEMYLSRDKVGVKPPIMEHIPMAVDLVSEFDSDPDCRGVLAYCYFKYNMLTEAAPLAMHSAQDGSKYGQFVCGLIQRNQRNYGVHNNGACYWFSLAVSQNYDEAQIGLAELYSSGKMTMGGTKEEDMREALRLRELAAEQGNDKAMLFIGYTHGDQAIALKKDENHQEEAQRRFEEACRWVGFAVESNYDGADRALRIITRDFEDVKPKRSKK
jgi:TPR repeat protein